MKGISVIKLDDKDVIRHELVKKLLKRTNQNKTKMSNNVIIKTDFNFPNQKNLYKGKVRDVYSIGDEQLVMIASIEYRHLTMFFLRNPYKGQVLNQIASKFLDATLILSKTGKNLHQIHR